MPELWTLNTMTFKGTVAGAVHSYGVLIGSHDRKYKIAELLNKAKAEELNAHAEAVGRDWQHFEADEPAETFMREEDLEECARVAFLFLAPPDAVLMVGMDPNLNPSKVLHAPNDEMRDHLNGLYERDEDAYKNGRHDVVDRVGAMWREAIQEYGLTMAGSSYSTSENLVATVQRFPGIERKTSPCGYDASVTIEGR